MKLLDSPINELSTMWSLVRGGVFTCMYKYMHKYLIQIKSSILRCRTLQNYVHAIPNNARLDRFLRPVRIFTFEHISGLCRQVLGLQDSPYQCIKACQSIGSTNMHNRMYVEGDFYVICNLQYF